MRIALVTQDWPDFTGGGVATLSLALATGLAELGTHVAVWTRGGGRRTALVEARASSPQPHPVAVHPVAGRSWRRRGSGNWRRGLEHRLLGSQPDAVVVTTWEPLDAVLAVVAAAPDACRPSVAVMAHGRDITGDPGAARREQRDRALGSEVLWLVLSRWMEGQLRRRGVPSSRIVTVPAAVEEVPRVIPRPPRPATTLLTVGRLIPRKGQDVVIEAIALLRERHPQLRYVVVGEGPDRGRLESLVARLGLQDRVSIAGWLDQHRLEAVWQEADLFVMPAREEPEGDTEGYGLVYLEAGARGLPVVGGRSGGVPAAVRSGVNGELVDAPRDAPAVAEVLEALLGDPEHMARLARAGRHRYEVAGRPIHLGRSVRDALVPALGAH
jgi:phosphatidylinositol alpha-1,6-mannosyltransferase